jgi:hypothetical protein
MYDQVTSLTQEAQKQLEEGSTTLYHLNRTIDPQLGEGATATVTSRTTEQFPSWALMMGNDVKAVEYEQISYLMQAQI